MSSDAAHPDPAVAQRLAHLYTLHKTEIDLRLGQSPYAELLHKLGDPHKRLPPVVHVAGTNGKGSVLAFMRAVLEAAGYKVHAYTSPHLITFNERIRLAGALIGDKTLITLYDRVSAANEGRAITFFEFTTAMAFLAFAETPADVVLLETGMGGRLDCTNVVDAPAVTAITKISYDHMEFLGTTLPQIAAEKAGIMKKGIPCIIGAQMDKTAVLPVFENAAKKLNVPLCVIDDEMTQNLMSGYPAPNLVGPHQIENAATALAALKHLKLDIPDAAKRYGISHADWPARLQHVTSGPVAALLPAGWELWFDAAHNDSGAQALGAQLRLWKKESPENPIHLIVGLAADKDVRVFFEALSGCYESVTLVDLPNSRKPSKAAETKDRLKGLTLINCYEKHSIREAVEHHIQSQNNQRIKLVICGSLYLYNDIFSPPLERGICK